MLEIDIMYAEYELEFGTEMLQSLLFVAEELRQEEVMINDFCAEYLRNPAKEHLRKYVRKRLEEDMGL